MLKVKDTLRSTVKITYDGRVIKTYHGKDAQQRFDNEVKILRYLEEKGCTFVPKLLEADKKKKTIITSSVGTRVDHIDEDKAASIFQELEAFGVRHDDPHPRNITYRFMDGRFCVIDFEFAEILPESK